MLKWIKIENKNIGDYLNIGTNQNNTINYKNSKLAYINETFDKRTTELSINEYVHKLKKQLILLEKLKQNKGYFHPLKQKMSREFSSSKIRMSIRSKADLFKNFRKCTVNDISNIIWNEPEQNGHRVTMALNLLQIPYIKFRINSIETLKEIDYIFNKRTRTVNEMIYLQHLLTLYDVVPSIYRNYDLIEPNEVLFNMAICLNMHKFNTNDLIFKYGEYNDKLFFVLSGSVSLFEPLERRCLMDINQYISYLNHLEKIKEYELIRKIIDNNKVYKNNNAIIKIKNDNDKHIRKKYLQKLKMNKELNKSQDYSLIEVNLNVDLNLNINTITEDINAEEIVSSDNYMKRVIPKFINVVMNNTQNKEGQQDNSDEKNIGFGGSSEEQEVEESEEETNKNMIKYYQYSLVKKVEPHNIFGEIILDADDSNKNMNGNNNTNYKKRELTAICNEPSRILYLDINNWQKYFKFRHETIKMKNLSTILDIPFLKDINKDYFKSKIFEHFSLFNYNIGEYVFKQNEKRKKIYFIRSGEVQLIMKASIYELNRIIEKKFDKNDNINVNKLAQKENIKFTDINYLVNKLNNEKKIRTWRILDIYPKDVIGLNELVDENNNYYFSAKCSSYNNEIYEIEYKKFKNMITEDKNVKSLFIQYNENKMNFILKRLQKIRTLYINDKLKNYKNFIKNRFSSEDEINNINTNNFAYKKKYLKKGMVNNFLTPSLSSNDLCSLSDKFLNIKSKNSDNINNYINILESKTATSSDIPKDKIIKNTISSNDEYSNENNKRKDINKLKDNSSNIKHNKKLNIKLSLELDNTKTIEDNNNFAKAHTLFKTRSEKLIKFKEFNQLINKFKKPKINKKNNKTQNSFFSHYIKEIKTLRLDNAKKLEITPFSDLLFSLAGNNNKKIKNMIKKNSSSNIEYGAPSNLVKNINRSSKFSFNKIECLILDKIVDGESYSKYNNNDLENKSTSLNNKKLKKEIKIINKRKQFPQHLIRRFEANRKISYFPEKYLQFVK